MAPSNDSELLRTIATTVERMDAKLFDEQTGFVPTTNDRLKNHTGRISRLEKWAWMLTGGGLVVAYIIGHHLVTIGK